MGSPLATLCCAWPLDHPDRSLPGSVVLGPRTSSPFRATCHSQLGSPNGMRSCGYCGKAANIVSYSYILYRFPLQIYKRKGCAISKDTHDETQRLLLRWLHLQTSRLNEKSIIRRSESSGSPAQSCCLVSTYLSLCFSFIK